jgi:GR25 family glycosyltransferase involved in LPS biosynthesis
MKVAVLNDQNKNFRSDFSYFSKEEIANYFSEDWDITIVCDDCNFFIGFPVKGLVYFKINDLKKCSIDPIFLYNIIFNLDLQGIICSTESDVLKIHDSPHLAYLKSRRNRNGNCIMIPLECDNLDRRFLSDLYNKKGMENIFYHAVSENIPLKTFVINLPHRTDRKERMIKKCDNILHELNFVEAVNGKNVPVNYIPNVIRVTEHYFLKKKNPYICGLKHGEIGCVFSHVKVWMNIIDIVNKGECDEKQVFCIFEDDIIFLSRYFEKLMKVLSELSVTNWDMCFLGHHDDIPGIDVPEVFNENVSLVKFNGHAKRTHGSGAFAYLINFNGAKKMMNCVYKYGVCQAIDWFIFEMFDEINAYKTSPHLVTSEFISLDSDIQTVKINSQ